MKIMNLAKILLIALLTMGMASCGDDYYTDDYLRNSDEKLCGKIWLEEYTTTEGELCNHQIKFALEGTGRETFQFYREGETRPYKENSYNFDWEWIDKEMENIEIDYGGGDIIYFDNVWVREHNLSGKLDGMIVMFVDAAYYN